MRLACRPHEWSEPSERVPRQSRDRRAQTEHGEFEIVSTAARALPVEKRGAYLQEVAALLRQRTGRASDDEVANAAQLALRTLVVSAA